MTVCDTSVRPARSAERETLEQWRRRCCETEAMTKNMQMGLRRERNDPADPVTDGAWPCP
jgi:hypothetical protein